MCRPLGSASELHFRRERAVRAVAGGHHRKLVARILGVHPKAIARWVRAARVSGGLEPKPQRGPAPGLSDEDLRTLEGLRAQGATAHGWPNELWTAARVAVLIERQFRIRYHPEHVRKILKLRSVAVWDL